MEKALGPPCGQGGEPGSRLQSSRLFTGAGAGGQSPEPLKRSRHDPPASEDRRDMKELKLNESPTRRKEAGLGLLPSRNLRTSWRQAVRGGRGSSLGSQAARTLRELALSPVQV